MKAIVSGPLADIPFADRAEMASEVAEQLLGGSFLIVGFENKGSVMATVLAPGSKVNNAKAEAAVHDILQAILQHHDDCSHCPACKSRAKRAADALKALDCTSILGAAAPDGSMMQ